MSDFQNTATVVGLGYVGLPTAALLAQCGMRVYGVDINQLAVDRINAGKVHIVEPGLEEVVAQGVREKRLSASVEVVASDVYVIAVPTPFKEGFRPDVSLVMAATASIAPHLKPGNLVILESTSPVGTTEQIAEHIAKVRPDLKPNDIHFAYCPERVLPGNALAEMVKNSRVIGGLSALCSKRAAEFYRHFVKGECVETSARLAEMCKLVENSFRDVNIAFANELSLICDKLNIDVWQLIQLANLHPRVKILQPGPGVGGHCIAVDPWFIVDSAPDEARLIRTAREVNDSKPDWVLEKIKAQVARFEAVGKTPKLACFGLAFKPNIDDLRESPALHIATAVAKMWPGQVSVVEPHIDALPRDLVGKAVLATAEVAMTEADILVLLVDHASFAGLKTKVAAGPWQVVDTRGLWT